MTKKEAIAHCIFVLGTVFLIALSVIFFPIHKVVSDHIPQ